VDLGAVVMAVLTLLMEQMERQILVVVVEGEIIQGL
jgi:hypothetical protein